MPEAQEIPIHDVLAQGMAVLGYDPGLFPGHEVLAGGASGAWTYRLHRPTDDLILKVTRPEGPGYLLERARREILFYRYLASEIHVQVPSLVASRYDPAIGACLLLKAYQPSPKPVAWTNARYIQAAEQLGRFHAGFWGKERLLSTLGWLRRVEGLEETDIRKAYRAWERLRSDGRFETILTPKRFTWVIGVLERIRSATFARTSLPITLCHGDFHIGNILMDRQGTIVLADWQEVGPGLGPEDLSFLVQRASFSGGTVPNDEMIDAYQRGLAGGNVVDVPSGEIRRVMDTAELRTRLLHWPEYLAGASGMQMTDQLEHIENLMNRLATSCASSLQDSFEAGTDARAPS